MAVAVAGSVAVLAGVGDGGNVAVGEDVGSSVALEVGVKPAKVSGAGVGVLNSATTMVGVAVGREPNDKSLKLQASSSIAREIKVIICLIYSPFREIFWM